MSFLSLHTVGMTVCPAEAHFFLFSDRACGGSWRKQCENASAMKVTHCVAPLRNIQQDSYYLLPDFLH